MVAEVISVGTELLLGQITDTNATQVGKALASIGVPMFHRQTVGDNLARLTEAIALAMRRADVVILIGGLGPTEDDLTRDALADATDVPLITDPALVEWLEQLFERRGAKPTASQLRQALRPESAVPMENPHGTAPGLCLEVANTLLFALPGPPNEFIPMLRDHVLPMLRGRGTAQVIFSRILRIAGLGEALAEEKARDLLSGTNPTVAPLAHLGEVHLRVTARASSAEEAAEMVAPIEQELRARLGDYLYGSDEETLEEVIVSLLRSSKATVATAESCSGGLLSHRLTNVPGSSDVFVGGVVAYSNTLKVRGLGVSEATLQTHGAVSQETAVEMAAGVRERLRSKWGVAITGVAGPGGGTDEKPVGLVYIAVADGTATHPERYQFIGSREVVKMRSAQAALTVLRQGLLRGGCASL